jgi:hypothetical protein
MCTYFHKHGTIICETILMGINQACISISGYGSMMCIYIYILMDICLSCVPIGNICEIVVLILGSDSPPPYIIQIYVVTCCDKHRGR